jgi:hypothetical protein
MHSTDEISFDITLRYASESPETISRSLGLRAVCSYAAGSKVGAHEHATTYWNATIGTSSGDESFDGLLESVVSFFNRNNAFCREFVDSGGEIDLILNGHVLNDGLGHEGVESKPKCSR